MLLMTAAADWTIPRVGGLIGLHFNDFDSTDPSSRMAIEWLGSSILRSKRVSGTLTSTGAAFAACGRGETSLASAEAIEILVKSVNSSSAISVPHSDGDYVPVVIGVVRLSAAQTNDWFKSNLTFTPHTQPAPPDLRAHRWPAEPPQLMARGRSTKWVHLFARITITSPSIIARPSAHYHWLVSAGALLVPCLHHAVIIDPLHPLATFLHPQSPSQLQDDRHISTHLRAALSIKPAAGCQKL
ncbi:hypothetical protein C8R45DRAFT_1211822 [Mycena sanguinolenta]|nr:hypothetical protein C8R45DRAFT_1211822 [Mycena sanguinolenta]